MIDTPEKAIIDSITGVQVTGKSNDDDIAFFSDKTIHYFPRGLEKFYKNLIGISIFYGRIKEIHQSDLEFYPKLKVIDLYQNDIDILEDGLFDFNPLLEVISFSHNKIFHIGSRIFEGLVKLTTLAFDENVCTEYHVRKDQTTLQATIPNLKNACTSQTFLYLEDEVEILEEYSRNLTRENFEVRFIDFEDKFKNEKFLRFLPLSIRYKFLKGLNSKDLPKTNKKYEVQDKNLEFFKNILNLISNLQKSQDEIVAKFADFENKISQIVPQTTNMILSQMDVEFRDFENHLVKKIKANYGN